LIISPLSIPGAFAIDIEPHTDERGFFARSFCVDEMASAGLETVFVQNSVSYNARAGTLRGMHFQAPPHEETKIVRCTRGAAFDVVLDLRPGSPTLHHWCGVEISEVNHRMLYVPKGLAHGFLTLTDDTTIEYQISERHIPSVGSGVRWNDPLFAITWPQTPQLVISERDAGYPLMQA
jgi:dTDP-4-dehydrorhamnose 3,5-epimerase